MAMVRRGDHISISSSKHSEGHASNGEENSNKSG